MPLGTNHITTTQAASFIPELWTTELIRATEKNLVLRALIKDYGVLGNGDQIHIPKISNLTTNAKAAATAVTFQNPTEGEESITINTHEEASFLVEDLVAAQSNTNLLREYTQKAGYALAESIDSDIAGLYSGLADEVGVLGQALTEDVLLQAVNKLDLADVPQNERFFVFHWNAWPTLIKIDRFTSQDFVEAGPDGRPVQSGVVHRLFGVPVIFTNNIVTAAGGSGAVTHSLLLQREAFGIAWSIPPTVEADRATDFLSDYVVTHAAWGVSVLRDDFAIEIKH